MFKKLPLLYKVLLITLLLVSLYYVYNRRQAGQSAVPQYQTAKAEKGTLIVALTSSGQITTSNSRTVTTTASGVVKKVFVKEGDKVKTGTPILQIDLDLTGQQKLQSAYSSYLSAQNSLKSAQDRLYSLESDFVGAKNVFDNQWASQSPDDPTYKQKHFALLTAQESLANQQKVINQAQAALQSSRLSYQLASSTVYAPISGTVTAISLTPGMILNPTSDSGNSSNIENKIALVKTGAAPTVSISLTEIDVPKVKVGNKVTITLDAFPSKSFTGKVIAVDTTGTVSSGVASYPTTIQFDSEEPEILANMSATANIITNIKDSVLLVPASAIQIQNGQSQIRYLSNGQLAYKTVEVGLQSSTQAEIISGISEGDEVVTSVTTPASSSTSSQSSSPFSGFGGGGGVRIMNR
ncbi:MAG: efflux RND transporter periplasmic adaptor subunit [Candidatus Shapirobacteria bacterium]|jgi:HlyD family secretion protein